ncbi:universal stress protein [Arthrobacter sp. M4]|uniref:universal stress protein n=1 Tax=Arthrobacter sp. M4 TaxID=218160 RepID=UPI001CDD7F4D|nr:universal stress protein [Arthrobacter sp. M4]MCA4134200.1 universal stress protein [Arthrobacter sp. M4]
MAENIVVVGVDGSETARLAADAARDIAAALGARLHIVTAFDSDRMEVYTDGDDTWVDSAADTAERTAGRVAEELESSEMHVSYTGARGKPAEALIEEAQRLDARMIVVGNKRMSGVSRVLGSVANSVAHHAPCDVYIVKTDV